MIKLELDLSDDLFEAMVVESEKSGITVEELAINLFKEFLADCDSGYDQDAWGNIFDDL